MKKINVCEKFERQICAKCGSTNEEIEHYPFQYGYLEMYKKKYFLCRNCASDFFSLWRPKFDETFNDFIQPERLNEPTPKGDAKV